MKKIVGFRRKKKRNYKYPENYQLQANSKKPAIHTEILKIFDESPHYVTDVSKNDLCDLDWYPHWLECQLSRISTDYVQVSCYEPSDSDSEHYAQPRQISLEAVDLAFWKVWRAVGNFLSANERCVIDDIVEYLKSDENVFIPSDSPSTTLYYQRQLLFAIVGWQSMLYLPSLGYGREDYLEFSQDVNQVNSGLVFERFSIHADNAEEEMSYLLIKYGNLLPARSPKATIKATETSRAAYTWSAVAPADLNIHVLSTILHLRVQWVDTMALHLDYDKGTRTLSLFRYPSMCVAALRSKATLYSFARESRPREAFLANREDITSMLREILSSYRLLFGQSKKSRQYFTRQIRRLHPALFSSNSDKLLSKLCLEKSIEHGGVPPDRPLYFAERDFPVLGVRLKLLIDDLKDAKPKTWTGLLRDRRDITQYWTFWLVAIFGSLSIVLGIVQAILQGLSIKFSSLASASG